MNTKRQYNGESGQAVIMLVTAFAILLIAGAAFAVAGANLWMTKQRAQVAARSACEAGSMDMLTAAQQNQPIPTSAGFNFGVAGTCGSASSGTICRYAADNGFTANGNDVNVSWYFPSSVSGTANTPVSGVPYPYLTVKVSKSVSTGFFRMFPGVPKKLTVSASSSCGVATPTTASKTISPGVVLFSTDSNGPDLAGEDITSYQCYPSPPGQPIDKKPCVKINPPSFKIYGGGQTSIYSNAATFNNETLTHPLYGDSTASEFDANVDLSQAGPKNTGGNAITVQTNPVVNLSGGSTTVVTTGAQPTGDALSWLPESSFVAGNYPPMHAPVQVSYQQDGCPDQRGCLEFFPGAYSSIIFGTGSDIDSLFTSGAPAAGTPEYTSRPTAIFMPGEYYMTGPLLSAGEVLRDATPCTPQCGPITSNSMQGLQPGENGILFYFASDSGAGQVDTPSINEGGSQTGENKDVGGPIVVYLQAPGTLTTVDPVSARAYSCGSSTNDPYPPPASTSEGTVLMGECDSKGAFDYLNGHGGSGPGVYDTSAPNRGLLFDVARSFSNGATISIDSKASDGTTNPTVLAGTINAFNSNYQNQATFLQLYGVQGNSANPIYPSDYILGSVFVGGSYIMGVNAIVEPSIMYKMSAPGSTTIKAAQF